MKQAQTKQTTEPKRGNGTGIRKAFKRLSHQVNRPIILDDAMSRGFTLPSQKQYKELSTLGFCIEQVRHLVATIAEKMKNQEELEMVRTRHKERYARRPELAKMDPQTHLLGRKEKTLKARHTTAITLLSELEAAYREMTKGDYQDRATRHKATRQPSRHGNRPKDIR
jgi:hypothetical protein